jgi:hypothetical protein
VLPARQPEEEARDSARRERARGPQVPEPESASEPVPLSERGWPEMQLVEAPLAEARAAGEQDWR